MFTLIKRKAPKRYTTEYCNIRNAIAKVMNHYSEYNWIPLPKVDINETGECYIKVLAKRKSKDESTEYLLYVVETIVLFTYFNRSIEYMNSLKKYTDLKGALNAIVNYVKETQGRISYELYIKKHFKCLDKDDIEFVAKELKKLGIDSGFNKIYEDTDSVVVGRGDNYDEH